MTRQEFAQQSATTYHALQHKLDANRLRSAQIIFGVTQYKITCLTRTTKPRLLEILKEFDNLDVVVETPTTLRINVKGFEEVQ